LSATPHQSTKLTASPQGEAFHASQDAIHARRSIHATEGRNSRP